MCLCVCWVFTHRCISQRRYQHWLTKQTVIFTPQAHSSCSPHFQWRALCHLQLEELVYFWVTDSYVRRFQLINLFHIYYFTILLFSCSVCNLCEVELQMYFFFFLVEQSKFPRLHCKGASGQMQMAVTHMTKDSFPVHAWIIKRLWM